MFNKALVVSKGNSRIDLHKNKIFGDYQNTNTIAELHNSGYLKAKSNPKWDMTTSNKIVQNSVIEPVIHNVNSMVKKSKNIEVIIKKAEFEAILIKELEAKKLCNLSQNAYKKALKHDCFYDVIKEDDKNVTVAFLPFSTSPDIILCGSEKFNKVHLLTNGLKSFYITRILYHKTMTKEEFIKWKVESKMWYQDKNFRKQLFNEIQKDLEKNPYSLLKDSDLNINYFNVAFFTNNLPKVKFKFTDFVE